MTLGWLLLLTVSVAAIFYKQGPIDLIQNDVSNTIPLATIQNLKKNFTLQFKMNATDKVNT